MEIFDNYKYGYMNFFVRKGAYTIDKIESSLYMLPSIQSALLFDVSNAYGNTYAGNADFYATDAQAVSAAKNANPHTKLKVYVSPQCTTPRDLIRNDYQIVRNISNAEVIVVPSKIKEFDSFKGRAAIKLTVTDKNGKELNLVYSIAVIPNDNFGHVDSWPSNYTQEDYIREHWDEMKARAIRHEVTTDMRFKDISYYSCCSYCEVQYDESIGHILTGNKLQNKYYVTEERLDVDMPNKITIDALFALLNCKDVNIVEKTLISCNWKQYPFTMWLVKEEKEVQFYKNRKYGKSKAYKAFANEIRRNVDYSVIQPEDYNLYQDLCLKMLGVNGRGLITDTAWSRMRTFGRYMPKKIAVSKIEAKDIINILDFQKQWE